jgi:hypothetical protein
MFAAVTMTDPTFLLESARPPRLDARTRPRCTHTHREILHALERARAASGPRRVCTA